MTILTIFTAMVERNYILVALEKDKAGLVRLLSALPYSMYAFLIISRIRVIVYSIK